MFQDRRDAGDQLAAALARYPHERPIVLALPRGGVPVAEPVAQALGADLDVLVVRKIGAPENPEFAIGAIGEDGAQVIDEPLARRLGLTGDDVQRLIAVERGELERRVALFRAGRPPLDLADRPVVIVDDGLATGSTAAAAVAVVRHLGAGHVTVAVPVGSRQAVDRLRALADDVVCLSAPAWFGAVGEFYQSFDQVPDRVVVESLARWPAPAARRRAEPQDADIVIVAGDVQLPGHLALPPAATGIVVFAHGSGSSRFSPRNLAVAQALNERGLGTLLVDLLTADEADDRARVFDIDLLAARLSLAVRWVGSRPEIPYLPIGLFGASTGAAAALVAAAQHPEEVGAVVARGGRPDLAGSWLHLVRAPTLLIVGGADAEVLGLNRAAQRELACITDLVIVPGATHLFAEPGALKAVAVDAGSWFVRHLTTPHDDTTRA